MVVIVGVDIDVIVVDVVVVVVDHDIVFVVVVSLVIVVDLVLAQQQIASRMYIATQQIVRILDGSGPRANIKMGNQHDSGEVIRGEKHTACHVWLRGGGQTSEIKVT